ncbi:MAG TPA: hypothetical protein VHW26_05515 [Solirubrobacteraceae bacterium]|nr:hypothetical protein [Solirubrobacteraceae bacterium]
MLVLIVAAVLARGGGGGPRRLLAGGGGAGGTFDPLAYDQARESAFEAAGAAGMSNVIYAKSPGGVVASAQRTESFAGLAGKAAAGGPADASTLEAIAMLESAGRPEVIAGADPSAAAGLTQIVAGTATSLLGMRVDLTTSRRLGIEIANATGRGQTARARSLEADRARIDQRFDPASALAATERYLKIAKAVFGREDLAIESYHMGIGNLETAIRRYVGSSSEGQPIARLVSDDDLSYAKLFFDSTPLDHASAYTWLAGLGDDSSTYLWRIQAAGQVLALYRSDPARLGQLAKLETGAPSAELVLRGAGTPEFATRAALAAGRASGAVIGLPSGARATAVGLRAGGPLHLRPEALATALYMAAAVRAIAGSSGALEVTSATTDSADIRAAAAASHGLAESDPLDASGYAFDVARDYSTPAEAQAFQFVLDRLQTLNLIAWNRAGRIIHIVVGPAASTLDGLLKTLLPSDG